MVNLFGGCGMVKLVTGQLMSKFWIKYGGYQILGSVAIKLSELHQKQSWTVLEVIAECALREHPSLLTLELWYDTLYALLYEPVR